MKFLVEGYNNGWHLFSVESTAEEALKAFIQLKEQGGVTMIRVVQVLETWDVEEGHATGTNGRSVAGAGTGVGGVEQHGES